MLYCISTTSIPTNDSDVDFRSSEASDADTLKKYLDDGRPAYLVRTKDHPESRHM